MIYHYSEEPAALVDLRQCGEVHCLRVRRIVEIDSLEKPKGGFGSDSAPRNSARRSWGRISAELSSVRYAGAEE
jgi:hypothetical protein